MARGSRSMVKSFKLQALEFPDQQKAPSGKLQAPSKVGREKILAIQPAVECL